MAKIFLRSGNLDAVLALGENGQPVYLSALQLRETLRLRKQSALADCLAIPQPNDAGDRLDWYSPVNGKVSSWAAASNSARKAALNDLLACQSTLAEISDRAQQSDKPGQKLFGALLSKALQFPDQNYVYLVGGKPVITFWGFVSLDKKSRQDAFDCLRAVEDDEPQLGLSRLAPVAAAPEPAAAAVSPVIAPLITPEPAAAPRVMPTIPPLEIIDAPQEIAADPAPALPATPAAKPPMKAWLRYSWGVPAVVLLVALGVQLKSCSEKKPDEVQQPEPAAATHAKPVPAAPPAAVTPAAPTINPPASTLPLIPAILAPANITHVAAAPAVETAPEAVAEPEAEVRPVAKDDLVLPADAVKIGSTKFLNGNWRVLVQKNLPTGTPPMLKYQMKNGKGTARITQGDGVSCKVEVFAGLMSSGNLVINSRTKARCSDGSRYQMPELVCKQGLSGPAECSGSYNADTVLPMTMKRESK